MELMYEDGLLQQVEKAEDGTWTIDNKSIEADLHRVSEKELHLILDGTSYRAFIEKRDVAAKELVLIINGERVSLRAKGRYEDLLESLGMTALTNSKAKDLKAPMPGLVLEVAVRNGQEVEEGDTLLVLEAMKMENVIKASAPGVVSDVKVAAGDSVEKGQILVGF